MKEPTYTIEQIQDIKIPAEYLNFKLEYKGVIFSASLDTDGILTIWERSGIVLVYRYNIKDFKTLEAEIYRCLNASSQGFVICSACRKAMLKKDVTLDWFAGRYCQDCTTPQMRRERNLDYYYLD